MSFGTRLSRFLAFSLVYFIDTITSRTRVEYYSFHLTRIASLRIPLYATVNS